MPIYSLDLFRNSKNEKVQTGRFPDSGMTCLKIIICCVVNGIRIVLAGKKKQKTCLFQMALEMPPPLKVKLCWRCASSYDKIRSRTCPNRLYPLCKTDILNHTRKQQLAHMRKCIYGGGPLTKPETTCRNFNSPAS